MLGKIIEWWNLNDKIWNREKYKISVSPIQYEKLLFSEKYHLNSDNEIFKIWLKQPWTMLKQYF